jgi:hypothetical protein
MDQLHTLPSHLAQYKPHHTQHAESRRDHLGLRDETLRQSADAKAVAFGPHLYDTLGIGPIVVFFVGDEDDAVFLGEAT